MCVCVMVLYHEVVTHEKMQLELILLHLYKKFHPSPNSFKTNFQDVLHLSM